jgi:hypothetical protein
MSRPVGSEQITLDDLRDAAERVRARIGRDATLTQPALATEAGISESGLRAWHERRSMAWPDFRDSLDYSAVKSRSHLGPAADDDAMKALWVPLDPDTAEALRELARAEHRHPREQAAVILAEAIRRRQPKPRPRLEPVA